MLRNPKIVTAAAFLLAAFLSFLAATGSVRLLENRSVTLVGQALAKENLTFAVVRANGLQVRLSGVAPDEAVRFQAVAIAGGIIDPDRLLDEMSVAATEGLDPLRFSVEMLRNGDGISLIGLIPTQTGRSRILNALDGISDQDHITDMLETADFPVPDRWDAALDFALDALNDLPRSKISVSPSDISITAITDSADEKRALETTLARRAPSGVALSLDISAPRPVITPFTLRFDLSADTARFEACTAQDATARDRILAAARAAGLKGEARCTIGLGVPTPRWPEAAELAIAAVSALDGGNVTFSDADITLIAPVGTDQRLFDRVIGELETELPDVFSLHASIIPAPKGEEGPDATPEFTATLSPEGLVQLRGRVRDDAFQGVVNSYAQALFGADKVYVATRIDDGLGDGWPRRVLAGLDGLGRLDRGMLSVRPDALILSGVAGNPDAQAQITQLLSDKLGEKARYELAISYDPALDPENQKPTPENCIADVRAITGEQRILFDPSSSRITSESETVIDRLAEVLAECTEVEIEIAGYTDSQGREEMNLSLSQSRADAVLNALLARRVYTGNFTARGYGEANPIADNDTEAGREANRRIEFTLLKDSPFLAPVEDTPDDTPADPDQDAPQPEDTPDE